MPPLLQTFSDSDSPQRRKSAKLGEIEILNLSEQKSGFCYCKPALNEVLILSRERLQSDGLGSPFDRVLPTRLVALYLRPMCIIQIFPPNLFNLALFRSILNAQAVGDQVSSFEMKREKIPSLVALGGQRLLAC